MRIWLDLTGIPKHDAVLWNIAVYISIWCDQHVVADYYITDDGCIDPNPYIISDGRNALARAAIFLTDCNALMDIDILSDPDRRVNGNAVRVSEIQSTADVAVYGKIDQMVIAG